MMTGPLVSILTASWKNSDPNEVFVFLPLLEKHEPKEPFCRYCTMVMKARCMHPHLFMSVSWLVCSNHFLQITVLLLTRAMTWHNSFQPLIPMSVCCDLACCCNVICPCLYLISNLFVFSAAISTRTPWQRRYCISMGPFWWNKG